MNEYRWYLGVVEFECGGGFGVRGIFLEFFSLFYRRDLLFIFYVYGVCVVLKICFKVDKYKLLD